MQQLSAPDFVFAQNETPGIAQPKLQILHGIYEPTTLEAFVGRVPLQNGFFLVRLGCWDLELLHLFHVLEGSTYNSSHQVKPPGSLFLYILCISHIKKNNGCGLHVHLFSTAIFLSGIRLLWDSPQVKHCVHVAWLWQGSCGPSWRCHPLNTQGCTRRTTQGCPDSRSVWIWGI